MHYALIVSLFGLSVSSLGAELKPQTSAAFDNYVTATEARINDELRPGGTFLYVDALPVEPRQRSHDRLMKGEILVDQRKTKSPGAFALR